MTAGLMCCVVVLLSYVRSFLFQYFLFRHRCSIWFRWLYEEFWEHNIFCKWKQFWCLCHLSSRQAFVSKNAQKKGENCNVHEAQNMQQNKKNVKESRSIPPFPSSWCCELYYIHCFVRCIHVRSHVHILFPRACSFVCVCVHFNTYEGSIGLWLNGTVSRKSVAALTWDI